MVVRLSLMPMAASHTSHDRGTDRFVTSMFMSKTQVMTTRLSEAWRSWCLLIVTISLALLLCACATPLMVPAGSRLSGEGINSLDRWVNSRLAVNLAADLSRMPRFEGESFAVVKLDGAVPVPAIDALTQRVRRDLESQLIRNGAISLVRHGINAGSSTCGTFDDAAFLIGLDTVRSDSELTVRVRVLDRNASSWVPQISFQYRGVADNSVNRLADRVITDTSLRGSRLVPFSKDDSDLSARRLARQFGCVLAQKRRTAEVMIRRSGNEDAHLKTLRRLLLNYIQQLPGISITDRSDHADYELDLERLQIDKDKSQLWLSARMLQAEVPMESTHVYMLNPSRQIVNDVPASRRVARLIEEFRSYTPASPALCATNTPWSAGRVALADSSALRSGSCFALRANLRKGAHVYLLHEAPDGSLTRLFPDTCDLQRPHWLSASDQFWYPGAASGKILDLDQQTGLEQFHLLAVENHESALGVGNALAGLPVIAKNCSRTRGIGLRKSGSRKLRQRIAAAGHGVDWSTSVLRHE